ncbi:hypothetical protein A8H37_13325 [Burkholderia thailandensis]|nr:hypothetical protein A8H37_13325 [Burkholderia thailandensis]
MRRGGGIPEARRAGRAAFDPDRVGRPCCCAVFSTCRRAPPPVVPAGARPRERIRTDHSIRDCASKYPQIFPNFL